MQPALRVKMFVFSLFLAFGACQADTPIKHVVFDLGGVLFEKHDFTMACHIGLMDLITQLFTGHRYKEPKFLMYDLFEQAGGIQDPANPYHVMDMYGDSLPQLFVDWQIGARSSKEIRRILKSKVKELKQTDHYHHPRAYRIAKRGAVAMTHPEIIADIMRVSSKGLDLLKRIYFENDAEGNPKYNLFVLSNWDPESFELLYEAEENHKVFKYFNPCHIMTSGKWGFAKPDPKFFKLLMLTYDLDPKECLFIDDQIENIKVAQQLGFTTVHWDYRKASKLIKQLQKMNIIS